MKVYQGIDNLPAFYNPIVSSGSFDGVHLGHQKIISYLKEVAQAQASETVLVTFWPHPRIVLGKSINLLNTIDEKIDLLDRQGIDHLVIIPFTQKFSQMSASQFVQSVYIDAIKAKKLVLGYDHHFGKNRSGNFDFLKKNIDQYPFEMIEIIKQNIDDMVISSSKIRKALHDGDIKTANTLLGRPYILSGVVVYGEKIGRDIGYPTANLHIKESYKIIPAMGVYAVKAISKDIKYNAMMYIGNRPTINHGLQNSIEVNIFDFDQDIYDHNISIEVIEYIRGSQKFEGLDALCKSLAQYKIKAIEILQNI